MSQAEILKGVANGSIKPEAAAKMMLATNMTLKVGEKGGVSICGLQRFPVTLYANQWETILDNADRIRAFMSENAGKLKAKGE